MSLKIKTLPVFLFVLLSQSAFSQDVYRPKAAPYHLENAPFSITDHLGKNIGCGGYARLGYLRSSLEGAQTFSASAIGGELSCSLSLTSNVIMHVGLFTSVDTGLNRTNKNDVHGDFFNQQTDGYLLLGEAAMVISFKHVELHLGRQRLDTPHMDGDDLRMVPNLFEAFMGELLIADNLYAGVGYVGRMSVWENSKDQADFVGIGDAFGGDGHQSWLVWVEYKSTLVSTNLWYYRLPDNVQIIYADISHKYSMNKALSYSVALQYDWGEDIGAGHAGVVAAKTWGCVDVCIF